MGMLTLGSYAFGSIIKSKKRNKMSLTKRKDLNKKDVKHLYAHHKIKYGDTTIKKIKRILNEKKKC